MDHASALARFRPAAALVIAATLVPQAAGALSTNEPGEGAVTVASVAPAERGSEGAEFAVTIRHDGSQVGYALAWTVGRRIEAAARHYGLAPVLAYREQGGSGLAEVVFRIGSESFGPYSAQEAVPEAIAAARAASPEGTTPGSDAALER